MGEMKEVMHTRHVLHFPASSNRIFTGVCRFDKLEIPHTVYGKNEGEMKKESTSFIIIDNNLLFPQ